MRLHLAFFNKICEKEQDRLCLWWGLFFAVGIICNLKYGLQISFAVAPSVAMLAVFIFARGYMQGNIDIICHIALVVLFFICGAKIAQRRADSVESAVSQNIKEGVFNIEGEVVQIRHAAHALQITVSGVSLARGKATLKPYHKKIRFNLGKKYVNQISPGDRIKCKARLTPPKGAVLPGGYDFSFRAKFAGIGMSGYSLSVPEITGGGRPAITGYFTELREKMIDKLSHNLRHTESAMAASILLGESGDLPSSILENMRISGISHIMCVSGLHLSLVCFVVFYLARLFMNFFPKFSQSRDVKIIAVFIALPAGLFYLALSGMKIAALRAFIMVAIIFIAIAAGRFTHPMRSVMVAAVGILAFRPEYIFFASFQLSFIAVIALIGGYEIYIQYKTQSTREPGIFAGVWQYFLFNIQASFLASVLTAPIVISHFYRFGGYSVFANLLAVPITSFIIMPFGIIGAALMPLGIEYLPLKIMSFGATRIIEIANFTASLPGSMFNVGYVTAAALGVYMAGFFWLFIFSSKVRFFGIAMMIVAAALMASSPVPSFIINFPSRQAGFYNADGDFEIRAKKISKFTARYWANYSGAAEPVINKNVPEFIINKNSSAAILGRDHIKLCPLFDEQTRTCKYDFYHLPAPTKTIIAFCRRDICRMM